MQSKITPDHLGRGAVVYVRQSTIGQVTEHTESQRRQYALADSARFCEAGTLGGYRLLMHKLRRGYAQLFHKRWSGMPSDATTGQRA